MIGLWECVWKTSAVTLGVWIVARLLGHRSAALRHSLWLCALAAFAVLPALLPLSHRTPPVRVNLSVPVVLTIQPQAANAVPVGRGLHRNQRGPMWSRLWVGSWLAGSLLVVVRRSRAVWRMTGITRRAAASDMPRVLLSSEIRTPLTWGLMYPTILLPSCAVDWSRERLEAVLEHERAHIRRSDPLWHWAGELVCAAWWFHPFAWLARSRAAHERECACDDAVIRSGVRPSDYASELLNLASTLPVKGEPIMALSALSDFERRIKSLVLPGTDRRPVTARVQLTTALAALAVIIPLAVLRAQAPSGQADLSGTVTDPNGARVPKALVIASGSEGNREITRADAAGKWSLSGIPTGNYTVEVNASGFAKGSSTITLAPGQRATLDQALGLGQVQQTINVVAQGQARREVSDTSTTTEPVRVGGNVQATKLIRQVKPAYPAAAKAQGIEGTVLLKAIIGKDGSLLSVVVINKLADPDLAAAALAAVQQWRYEPTLLNGEPVEVVTTITMNFSLQM